MRTWPRWMVGAALLAPFWQASAHDSPGDVIHLLTDRIESQGATARLLTSRAYEYQTLGDWDEAVADFQHALKLQPGFAAAVLGCAESLLHKGAYADAESVIRAGLMERRNLDSRAPFEAILARILAAQSRWPEARDAWRAALRASAPEPDWFLGEAESLARMERWKERVDALADAVRRNPSVVLERAWIHALVDAGDLDRASTRIEAALDRSRWKSTWLLLRARVNQQRNDGVQQQRDAAAAVAEISSRLNSNRPTPHLMAEMANALTLLGKDDEARAWGKEARRAGYD